MKPKILKILLYILLVINICSPVLHGAVFGYNDLAELLSQIYDNGTIVVLSAAILYLINDR